jgi:hypothetical protein
MKTCSKCGFEKPLEEFGIVKQGDKQWRRGKCKECESHYHREYNELHADEKREKARKVYQDNPEPAKKRARKQRELDPEKIREEQRKRYWENPEKYRALSRKHKSTGVSGTATTTVGIYWEGRDVQVRGEKASIVQAKISEVDSLTDLVSRANGVLQYN